MVVEVVLDRRVTIGSSPNEIGSCSNDKRTTTPAYREHDGGITVPTHRLAATKFILSNLSKNMFVACVSCESKSKVLCTLGER